jgi:hypothetical protein
MYADPSLVREKTVKLSFNDLEHDLIQAWVKYIGGQKAEFLRNLVLEQARLDLGLDVVTSERPQMALLKVSNGTSE